MKKNADRIPTGVIAFGVIHIIYSAFLIMLTSLSLMFAGIMILPIFMLLSSVENSEAAIVTLLITLTIIITLIVIAIGILGIIGSIGAFTRKKWGRKLIIITAITLIVIASLQLIMAILSANIFFIIITPLFLAYFISLLAYFNKPHVKEWFEIK